MIQLGIRSKTLMTYDEAVLYCFFYNQEGSSGWRMPTEEETYDIYYDEEGIWYDGDGELEYYAGDCWYALPVRDI
jgi:hypothetical protein